jgi:hypothetical protein
MLLGLALAAAVAGGNLAVTAPSHPPVGRYVTIRATGQVGRDGELFTYRNRGARCAVSRDAEEALGPSKALELHAAHKVEGAFEFRTAYFPTLFGVTEWICSYLYATTCDVATGQCGSATGLPPDAGFSRTRLSIRFALPPGWTAGGSSSAVRMSAVPGSGRRARVTVACARGLRLPSITIDRGGRFDYADGRVHFRGRVLPSARRVTGRLTADGCGTRRINLAARAPQPTTPAGARPARARPATP